MKVNSLKVKGVLITLFILLISLNKGNSQDFQFNLNYIQGLYYTSNWDANYGGMELNFSYRIPTESFNLSTGLGLRTIQWGSQMMFSLELSKRLSDKFKLRTHIDNGIALFRPQPFYVFASGVGIDFTIFRTKKIALAVTLEGRYSICPNYKNYSLIYSVVEMPLGFFISF